MMEVIKTNSLTKHFGTTVAANDISIQVNQGEIYGFLGLNGAGGEYKDLLDGLSYTILILTGIVGYFATVLYWKFADQTK